MATICSKARSGWHRWLIFNSVGAMGIVVQMFVLFILTHYEHLNYLLATAFGVEAAVLHNFVWHEHWTWADRAASKGSWAKRLIGFHIANGAFSLFGNLILMRLLVGKLGLNFMFANGLAIAVCSIANFLASDRVVYRAPGKTVANSKGKTHQGTQQTELGRMDRSGDSSGERSSGNYLYSV